MRHSTEMDYRYNRRLSLHFGDKLEHSFNVCWDADIISAAGAHYHFWAPPTLKGKELDQWKKDAKYYATRHGDPVAYSWSYIPKGE